MKEIEQKEIEEIANIVADNEYDPMYDDAEKIAIALYSADYRLASEVRNKTAKEILQELFDDAIRYGKNTDGIKWKAKKYGISLEVQNERD